MRARTAGSRAPVGARSTAAYALASLVGLGGCAVTQTSVDVLAREAAHGEAVRVRIEPCVDRTHTADRDLGAEASRLFAAKLGASREFSIADDAQFRIACDVTKFVPGSAFKRWLMPGLGPTVGQVSVMVSDAHSGTAVVILRGNATVASGGLYSVGAEDYILESAIDDVVSKLRAWARGGDPSAAEGGKP